jgi:hypothetical protein
MSIRNDNKESVDVTTGKIADVFIVPTSVTGTDVDTSRAYNNGSVCAPSGRFKVSTITAGTGNIYWA